MVDVKLTQVVIPGTNPRKHFNQEKFNELVESVRKRGILEPVIVRELNHGTNKFELVCGERRFKAAQEAKLLSIPVVVKELTDSDVLEIQIIENVQREELTPLEEAFAFKALIDKCKYKQEDIAKKIGKTQSYIALRLSLLDLREDFQKMLEEGKITPGHAKFLLVLKSRDDISDKLLKKMKGWLKYRDTQEISINDFEGLVKEVIEESTKKLIKDTYGGGAEFDLKACTGCKDAKSIETKYNGKQNRCFNSECYNQKQAAAKKADKERIRSKVANGKVVPAEDLPKDYRLFENCKFDKKTCAKCKDRKVAPIKERWGNAVSNKEVCINKDCFDKKKAEGEAAEVKKDQEKFDAKVKLIKAEITKHADFPRAMWVQLLELTLQDSYGDAEKALCQAFGLDEKEVEEDSEKYFTRNIKLEVEQMVKFVIAWSKRS